MVRICHFLLLAALLACCGGLPAQDKAGTPAAAPAPTKPSSDSKTPPRTHKFWDTENICLFSGVGATRMLDYASTRHLRDQGDNEWLLTNAIVDNRPLFVGIELAGTAASIGVSYLFHRTGHHTLERWVSIAHIGVGVGGSIHNYALKPAPGFTPAIAPVMAFQPER
jgi:hypothetical protein